MNDEQILEHLRPAMLRATVHGGHIVRIELGELVRQVRALLEAEGKELRQLEKRWCIEGDYVDDGVHPVEARLRSLNAEILFLRNLPS